MAKPEEELYEKLALSTSRLVILSHLALMGARVIRVESGGQEIPLS